MAIEKAKTNSETASLPGKHKPMKSKGVFFTFSAITLSIIILVSLTVYKNFEMKEKIETIGVRIETVNNFIKDIEQDLEKGLFISSFRAFLTMEQSISTNGTFIESIEDSFDELVLKGTLDSTQFSLMKDSTFTDWTERIEAQAEKIGILVNFTIIGVDIAQVDPWFILIDAEINLSVMDKKNTSSWNRNKNIITRISIENFEDPLYVVNSKGRVTNPIVKTPFDELVMGSDISNLLEHLNSSYYIATNISPNFLMRLEGNLSNSSAGIESLVNLEEFQAQGLPIKDRSAVDYIYFGTKTTTNFRINQTPAWFKIDQDHLTTYQVENQTI
jgi:hypothetical protein